MVCCVTEAYFGDHIVFNGSSFQKGESDLSSEHANRVFHHVLVQRLGERRALEVERRVGEEGCLGPLTERRVSKILHSTRVVTRDDMQEAARAAGYDSVEELSPKVFYGLYDRLSHPLDDLFAVDDNPSYSCLEGLLQLIMAIVQRIFYDPYRCIKNFTHDIESHRALTIVEFYEKTTFYGGSFDDLKVGTYCPAPDSPSGERRTYRIAASLVTGEGYLAKLLLPAAGSDLDPLYMIRGTQFSLSNIDSLGAFITDFEEDIGKSAFLSSQPYMEQILSLLKDKKMTVIGLSLGGCLGQWVVAHYSNAKKLYTFRSPGVPQYVADKFNQKTDPFTIYCVRQRRGEHSDAADLAGDCHLGADAPLNVGLRYAEFNGESGTPHTHLPLHRHIAPGIEGGWSREEINEKLSNSKRSGWESVRKCLGSYFFEPIFRFIRWLFCLKVQPELIVEDNSPIPHNG